MYIGSPWNDCTSSTTCVGGEDQSENLYVCIGHPLQCFKYSNQRESRTLPSEQDNEGCSWTFATVGHTNE